MTSFKLLGAALLALALCGPAAEAKGPNALDAYVARPDPSFDWKVVGPISGEGYHGAVLELTSQTWDAPKDVDRTVWKHWLTVIVPDQVGHDKAFFTSPAATTTTRRPPGPGSASQSWPWRPAPWWRSWTMCPTSR